MTDLIAFQQDLLAGLAIKGETHGLGLKEFMEEDDRFVYGEDGIHHGRLYPNLDTLVNKGLVKKTQEDRRTNNYELTRRGGREVSAIGTKWEDAQAGAETR